MTAAACATDPSSQPSPGLRRLAWRALALVGVALGAIGAVLPGLPTVPFLLAAAMAEALPLADWAGLDLKAPPADNAEHDRITGVRGSAVAARRSLALLAGSGVADEVRSTVHPTLHDVAALHAMAEALAATGIADWVLQVWRPTDGTLAPIPPDWPPAALWPALWPGSPARHNPRMPARMSAPPP